MTTRQLSTAAQTAKAIKAELKQKYPNTTFRVKSANFSMGNSVDVYWIDGQTTDQINNIIKKYQYGHFDGMIDMYENSNSRDDIPQAKFVFANRNYSRAAVEQVVANHNAKYSDEFRVNAAGNDGYAYIEYTGSTREAQDGRDTANRQLRETTF